MVALNNSVYKPLIRIIVNCFNGEKYLKESLLSILKQTYSNWEVIFWDNQSSDNSKKIFSEFKDKRFKYFISEKHTPLYEARNNAIQNSKGELIAFLDTDDWWKEDKLEKQVSFFEDNKVGIVYSNCLIFFEKSKKTKIFSKKILRSGYITKDLFKDYKVSIMTVLLRRIAYDSASGFNSKYNIIGDFDLIIRLSNNWKFVSIQEPLAYYRIHNDNFSLKNEIIELEEFENLIEDSKIISDENLRPHLHYINQRIIFLKTVKYINDGKFMKAIKNIIYFPINFNKIKLIMYIFLPKKLIKKMQGL